MDETAVLPDPPERPIDSDCCGNGCTPCILDIYEEDLHIWKLECQAIQKGTYLSIKPKEEEQAVVNLTPDGYNWFSISNISKETHDSLRLKFSLPTSQILGLSIGQHLIIRSTTPGGLTYTRQFTPVSPISAKGFFELIIKVYSDGRMSKYVKDWKVGDQIAMRGPAGGLDYAPNKYAVVLMLCAGTGIAPMCQVIHAILDNEEEDTRIRLLYACRTYQDLLAKSELDEWKRFWNFTSHYVLSQEPDVPHYSYKYGDSILKSHIDKSLLHSELKHAMDKTLVMLCGTPSFESDILKYLEELGVPQSQIHKF